MALSPTLDERKEVATWRVHTLVQKWNDPADHEAGREPDEVVEDQGNILLNDGITRILSLMIGAGGQPFSSGIARLGVGDGTTPPSPGDIDLAGTAKFFHGLDVGYPSLRNQTVAFRATYQDDEANFPWKEWGIDQGGGGTGANGRTVGFPLLNRRVPTINLGTKEGGVWSLTVQTTLR